MTGLAGIPRLPHEPSRGEGGSVDEEIGGSICPFFRGAELLIVRVSDGHSTAVLEPCVNIIYQTNVMIIMA